MKKTKTQRGITLIALIITIVVLLILAAVAISSIQNDGIISYANNAVKDYEQAQKNEQDILDGYLSYIPGNGGSENGSDGGEIDVTDGATMFAKETNTKIEDIYGNKITIPAGFKISVENTGYTKDTLDVTKGIVIEDEDGNQFVWIPCGTIYTSANKSTSETITLGRYSWSGSTGTLVQPTADNPYTSNVEVTISSYNYTEYQSGSTTPTNAIARNINDFHESVMGTAEKEGNGGYYLGRYEAGNSSDTLVCKAEQTVYNNVTQPTASSLAQGMYADGYSTGTFSSDLINSYAWDTAIVFIQTFGSSTYANTIGESSIDTSAPQTTGTNILSATGAVDEQLNIYDMAGNCFEWSTETSTSTVTPCVYGGGFYSGTSSCASDRNSESTTYSDSGYAFRPLLYVGL